VSTIPPQPPAPQFSFWDRLQRIDRRLIYLFLAATVVVPLFKPFPIRPLAMEPAAALFRIIDSIPPEKTLVISADYGPSFEGELQPMLVALLRHAFARHTRVGVLTLAFSNLGLTEMTLDQVTTEFNFRARIPAESIRYGKDYVYWGWQYPPYMVVTGLGEDIAKVFRTDFYGNRTDSLPIMEGLRNYDDIGTVVCISHSHDMPFGWVMWAHTVYGTRIGAAVSAQEAADIYPYFSKTRQICGIMDGVKGNAEYEELVEEHYPATGVGIPGVGAIVKTAHGRGEVTAIDLTLSFARVRLNSGEAQVPLAEVQYHPRRRATENMSAQTTGHLGMMLLIVIGNIGFFALRRKKK
jgi:hypothetical protein